MKPENQTKAGNTEGVNGIGNQNVEADGKNWQSLKTPESDKNRDQKEPAVAKIKQELRLTRRKRLITHLD